MRKICSRGHAFEKTSLCPTCPVCWPGQKKQVLEKSGFPEGLAAPALRALDRAGIRSLARLALRTEADIAALHGMGPKALAMLKTALRRKKLKFANGFMTRNLYALRAKLWLYPGKAAWHFLTLPKKEAAEIKIRFGAHARGWRSLPVAVTIGSTRWLTSIFPDSKTGSYLLPLKAAVRKKEKLDAGKIVAFALKLQA